MLMIECTITMSNRFTWKTMIILYVVVQLITSPSFMNDVIDSPATYIVFWKQFHIQTPQARDSVVSFALVQMS